MAIGNRGAGRGRGLEGLFLRLAFGGRRAQVMVSVALVALLLGVQGIAAASLSVSATRLVLQPGDLAGASTKLSPRRATRSRQEWEFGVSLSALGWVSGAAAEYSFGGRDVYSEALVFDTGADAHRAFVVVSKREGRGSGITVSKLSIGAESRMFTLYAPSVGPGMARPILWRYQSVVGYVSVGSPRPFPAAAAITIARIQSRRMAATVH
jgi:hypothetical protein